MGTVDRVLPWRRNHARSDDLAALLATYQRFHPKASTTRIAAAYERAFIEHMPQQRTSMESYINHPLAVAREVAQLGQGDIAIAAALLHDVAEDTAFTVDDIRRDFGDEVADIVDGVTKLDKVSFESKEEHAAATARKFILAAAKDPRVIVIKLADRLHNMRTLAARPRDKQEAQAQETLDIYAPLAERVGVLEIRTQLEDLAFAALRPRRFAELDHMVATRSPSRDNFIAGAVELIRQQMAGLKINAEVTGRGKHLYGIYDKMTKRGLEFEEIFDLVALRVVVDSTKDCYAALGELHRAYTPIDLRFKDLIANPKPNGYQSLHTTVIWSDGRMVEFQIRTREMHQRAEQGIAGHWAYKVNEPAVPWLRRVAEWQADVGDARSFMDELRGDLARDQIYVLTPRGDLIELPAGSTPVDFAYAVHTQLGDRCVGAKVNGQLAALDHRLAPGDSCEIFTSKLPNPKPSAEWLTFVKSARAKNKISRALNRDRRDDEVGLQESSVSGAEPLWIDAAERRISPGIAADINVRAYDRIGLLRDIATLLTDDRINIVKANVKVDHEAISHLDFTVQCFDPKRLHEVVATVKSMPRVYDATVTLQS